MSDTNRPFWQKIFGGANPIATIVADTVVSTASGIADIADRFIDNPQERAQFRLEMGQAALEQQKLAMQKDVAILEDRASARKMAGTHGKLQIAFAMTFLVGFFALLIADLGFIGWLVMRRSAGEPTLAEWLQILVTNTLTGVLAYMVSMLKEVVGFLFGGSAGGDESSARLVETLRNSGTAQAPE